MEITKCLKTFLWLFFYANGKVTFSTAETKLEMLDPVHFTVKCSW